MKGIRFGSVNMNYGQPDGWDEERDGPCHSLPVYRDFSDNTCASVWKLTWRERLALFFGAKIVLTVKGYQPPVALEVQRIAEVAK